MSTTELVPHDLNGKWRRYPSLLAYLQEEHGDSTTLTTEAQMMQAKKAFIIDGMTPREISRRYGTGKHPLPVWVINRWRTNFGWDEARKEREYRMYQRVCGDLKKIKPDLEIKTVNLMGRLEDLIEELIEDRQQSGEQFTPAELKQLVTTAQTLQTMRRTQVGKPSKLSAQMLALKNPEMMPNLVKMLTGLVQVEDDEVDENVIDVEYTELESA